MDMISPKEEDWSELYGCAFSQDELIDACDFYDIIKSYGVDRATLNTFVREDMKTGYRLFLVMNMPLEELGILALKESDERLVKVIKNRCNKINRENDGRSKIILPSEI